MIRKLGQPEWALIVSPLILWTPKDDYIIVRLSGRSVHIFHPYSLFIQFWWSWFYTITMMEYYRVSLISRVGSDSKKIIGHRFHSVKTDNIWCHSFVNWSPLLIEDVLLPLWGALRCFQISPSSPRHIPSHHRVPNQDVPSHLHIPILGVPNHHRIPILDVPTAHFGHCEHSLVPPQRVSSSPELFFSVPMFITSKHRDTYQVLVQPKGRQEQCPPDRLRQENS